jgi:DNA-binding transcriptional MerR regulator
MYAIGTLAKRTGVKVATIRYYEQAGILAEGERTAGNQRRYDKAAIERLRFIKHARELGFSIKSIADLITLQDHPDRSCATASGIAKDQLSDVRAKIARLRSLEQELNRIAGGCTGDGTAGTCYVLASLADHGACTTDHQA